jgi:hypothetical protein
MQTSATDPARLNIKPPGLSPDAANGAGVLSLIGYGFTPEIITQRLTEIP